MNNLRKNIEIVMFSINMAILACEMKVNLILFQIMIDVDLDGDDRINLSEFQHIASKVPDFAG